MTLTKDQKINIFTSVFKARTDVYAFRWEKWDGSYSGYSPAYQDKNKKEYAPLSSQIIEQHLRGIQTIGIYPLLEDNTCWLVAADFDGSDWFECVKRLLDKSREYNLSCYLERSRSGKGGHVWWFFEEVYPAHKARKIFLNVIKESNNVGQFDKADSFDRLFPNQDYHTGKGLGNLIALPLQGQSRKQGNSVFLEPGNNCQPAQDQWKLLSSVQRISPKQLDEFYNRLIKGKTDDATDKINIDGKLPIILNNYIVIPKTLVSKELASFLTDNLNFFNNEYAIKQKMGLSVYKLEKYFKTIGEDDKGNILIPRGFLNQLTCYLDEHQVKYIIKDQRQKFKPVKFNKPTFELRDYQQKALNTLKKRNSGILVAPPSSGKTIMGLSLIAQKKQPSLIIVHRKQIYNQWLERIENFLKLPKRKIGQYVSGKKNPLLPITVAMIQTLAKTDDLSELSKKFGLLIIDECHHMPAKMFRKVITQFNPYYLYGLTATPTRKHNDEKLIFIYTGDIVHQVPDNFKQSDKQPDQLKLIIKETKLNIPLKVKSTDFQLVSKILCFDSQRNQQIIKNVFKQAKSGHKCLVLSERKEHLDVLNFYLKQNFETIVLTGVLSAKKKKERLDQINTGHFQIILATGQLLGEGSSFSNLDSLFLVFPFSYQGKLIQYIGRIQHGQSPIKTIFDYHDKGVDYLDKMFKQRRKCYGKMELR